MKAKTIDNRPFGWNAVVYDNEDSPMIFALNGLVNNHDAVGITESFNLELSSHVAKETASKDKQIEIQQAHIDDQDQLIFDQTKEIAELKEAISELIQVKDWKDKYGKDEHYLKAMPIAWENARKLIVPLATPPTTKVE